MPRRAGDRATNRANPKLTRGGIVAAAVALADRDGLTGLTMRRLAEHLGVDAMSIYYHVRDKDNLLAAMADAVAAEIGAGYEPGTGPWTTQLRALVRDARQVMLRHPWAARVLEGRDSPGPGVLAHLNRVLGVMRGGGCSLELCHHAIHLFGSRLFGFSQDLFDDSADGPPPPPEQAAAWAATMPHIAELAGAASHTGRLGGCDDDVEFAFALDLLLDALERRRSADSAAP